MHPPTADDRALASGSAAGAGKTTRAGRHLVTLPESLAGLLCGVMAHPEMPWLPSLFESHLPPWRPPDAQGAVPLGL